MSQLSALTAGIAEREHPRVEANLMVKILINGRTVMAKAKDLSMAGMYLVGVDTTADQLTVALPLPSDREIVTRCEVKRRNVDGLAIEFEFLDWDDLFALARFLHPRLP